MTYCIDTSSLIAAWGELYPIEHFPKLWEHVEALVQNGRLKAPVEVLHETKRRSTELHKWLGKRKAMFVDIDEDIQRRQTAIMAAFPKLIDTRRGHFAADPWVIALSIERGLVLVTQERFTGKPARPNIPDVCADGRFKTDCINLLDLIRREKWIFS
ncbi:MAG TPA: DUF4411 family protein [Hyphomicrobiaceae bacterium]|nr:DUF4411 family protein [Hyphomicrobiaceae bacterium]